MQTNSHDNSNNKMYEEQQQQQQQNEPLHHALHALRCDDDGDDDDGDGYYDYNSTAAAASASTGQWMMGAFPHDEEEEEQQEDGGGYHQLRERLNTEEEVDYGGPAASPLAFPTPIVHQARNLRNVPYLYHDNNIVVRDADQSILVPQENGRERAYLFKKALTKSSFGSMHLCIVLKRRTGKSQRRQESRSDCDDTAEESVNWIFTDELVVLKVSSLALMSSRGRPARAGSGSSKKKPAPMTNTVSAEFPGTKLPNNEAAAMQHVGNYHASVLGCIEVLRDSKHLYTVVSYCPGGDLYRRMLPISGSQAAAAAAAAHHKKATPTAITINRPSEDRARLWFRQVLAGLAHLQKKGVCHCALSLENILLDREDNAVLCDLGMALRVPYAPLNNDSLGISDVSEGSRLRRLIKPQKSIQPQQQQTGSSSSKSSSSGSSTGANERYMAPELLAMNQAFDGYAVDLWSAAVILFVMLVGWAPFRRAKESDSKFVAIAIQGKLKRLLSKSSNLHHEISPEAIDLLQSMLRMDPRKRLSLAQVMSHPWVIKECIIHPSEQQLHHASFPSLHPSSLPISSGDSSTASSSASSNKPTFRKVMSAHQLHNNNVSGHGNKTVHFDPSVVPSVGREDNNASKQIGPSRPPCLDCHPNTEKVAQPLQAQKDSNKTKKNVLQPLEGHYFSI